MRVGFKQTVVVTSTTPITSIAAVDARIITVAGATGSTTASVVITPVNGSYGVGKLRIGNSGGELVDLNVTVLGIDTTFVARMIGIASSDIGTLCRGLANGVQKINKWSKWKPIIYPHVMPLTDLIIKDSKCGFSNLTSASGCIGTLASFITKYLAYDEVPANNFEWLYAPPTGGATQPYRLDDFRGYEPTATPLFKHMLRPNNKPYDYDDRLLVSQQFPAVYFRKTFSLYTSTGSYWNALTPADIHIQPSPSIVALSAYHLGVLVFDLGTNAVLAVATNANPLSSVMNNNVTLSFKDIDTNEYLGLIFFLSPRAITQTATAPTQSDYILIDHPFYPLSVINGKDNIYSFWLFDRDELQFEYLSSTSDYSVEWDTMPTIDYGIAWAAGQYFWLEPYYGLNDVGDNEVAYEIQIDADFQNLGVSAYSLITYSHDYNPDTEVVTWESLSIKRNSTKTRVYIGAVTGVDDDYVDFTGVVFDDIASIIFRNFAVNAGETIISNVYLEFLNDVGVSLGSGLVGSNAGFGLHEPGWFRFGYAGATFGSVSAPVGCTFSKIDVRAVVIQEL